MGGKGEGSVCENMYIAMLHCMLYLNGTNKAYKVCLGFSKAGKAS